MNNASGKCLAIGQSGHDVNCDDCDSINGIFDCFAFVLKTRGNKTYLTTEDGNQVGFKGSYEKIGIWRRFDDETKTICDTGTYYIDVLTI